MRERVLRWFLRRLTFALHRRHAGLVVGLIFAGLTVIFGTLGFGCYHNGFPCLPFDPEPPVASSPTDNVSRPWWTIVYLAVQLIVLESSAPERQVPLALELARFFGAATAAVAVTTALLALFANQLEDWLIRHVRGHVVVCGFGSKGASLVEDLLDWGLTVVVVDQNLREADIAALRESGAGVVVGDATTQPILRRAGCDRAGFIVVSCGDDATGVEIAMQVLKLTPEGRETPPPMYLHLEEPELVGQLERLVKAPGAGQPGAPPPWTVVNLYDSVAKTILDKHFVFDRAEVIRRTHPDKDTFAVVPDYKLTLAVVGDTPLADRLIDNLVQAWEPRHAQRGEQLHLVVIGRAARQRIDLLRGRLPALATVCNVQVVAHDVMDLPPEQQRDMLADVSTVYICRDSDSAAAATAIALWRQIDERRTRIIVSFDRRSGIADLVGQSGGTTETTDRLVSFALAESFLGADLVFDSVTEELATLIRDEYHEQLRLAGQTAKTNPYLDITNEPAQTAALQSSRRQAEHTLYKLDRVGYTVKREKGVDPSKSAFKSETQMTELAMQEHDRWNDERLLDGWEVGKPTDRKQKIHENLVPWDRVPDDIQDRDRDVIRRLPMRLALVDFTILPKRSSEAPTGRR